MKARRAAGRRAAGIRWTRTTGTSGESAVLKAGPDYATAVEHRRLRGAQL